MSHSMMNIVEDMHIALSGKRLIPLAQEGHKVSCPAHGTTWVSPRENWCPKCEAIIASITSGD